MHKFAVFTSSCVSDDFSLARSDTFTFAREPERCFAIAETTSYLDEIINKVNFLKSTLSLIHKRKSSHERMAFQPPAKTLRARLDANDETWSERRYCATTCRHLCLSHINSFEEAKSYHSTESVPPGGWYRSRPIGWHLARQPRGPPMHQKYPISGSWEPAAATMMRQSH